MKIFKLEVQNFRLLKNFSMDLEEELSLVIGKNNTGKTSILTALSKFLNHSDRNKFSYNDFSIDFKNHLETVVQDENEIQEHEYVSQGISLKLYITYGEHDDLSNISQIMMDLDPDNNVVVLGFEYVIDYNHYSHLRADFAKFTESEKEKQAVKKTEDKQYEIKGFDKFLENRIENYFELMKKSLAFDCGAGLVDETKFINLENEKINLDNIISFKYINAKREVANKEPSRSLSNQTSRIYKKAESTQDTLEAISEFQDKLIETDVELSKIYGKLFTDVLKKVKDFGGIKANESELDIISTLQHKELLEGNTTVVYKHDADNHLPEHYNGLGYMNLISMIFEIEILVHEFKRDKDKKPADINLLFIEEPEAHTHPQMQYVFIKNIKKLLGEGIKREDGIKRDLQYIISTHSACIVADSDFDDIKYLKRDKDNKVKARNLKDLRREYEADPMQYQFLKQYLTISRAEIFFADKAVLIEGDTERILIPTFMRKIDIDEENKHKAAVSEDDYLPLLSQNVSVIEVGAYSQIFKKFITFLGIKSLIITDIDSVKAEVKKGAKKEGEKESFISCPVNEGTGTSNSALKAFFDAKPWDELKSLPLPHRIVVLDEAEIMITYQTEENGHHGRSFEDAFIALNKDFIKEKKSEFRGLKNIKDFDDDAISPYDLAQNCIKKKTHFALDLLYHNGDQFNNWQIPSYIKDGLLWLKKD